MKNFWRKLTGPSGWLSPAHLDKGVGLILSPFLILMLLAEQVGDVFVFALRRLAGMSARANQRLVVAIDKTGLSLGAKYVLMQVIGWLPTGVLIVLIFAIMGTWVSQARQSQRQASELTNAWAQMQTDVQDEILTVPETIKIASETAVILVDENKLDEKRLQLEQKASELGQVDMINLSLIYHYQGQLDKSHTWLEKARQLDPNSEFLAVDKK